MHTYTYTHKYTYKPDMYMSDLYHVYTYINMIYTYKYVYMSEKYIHQDFFPNLI